MKMAKLILMSNPSSRALQRFKRKFISSRNATLTTIAILIVSSINDCAAQVESHRGHSLPPQTWLWLNPTLNRTNRRYNGLPSDTLTHVSPHRLTVTKASSHSGTTSTVRPWPSHNFFRSVLSKSDNLVIQKNRSFAARKSSYYHTTGTLHFPNSTIAPHEHTSSTPSRQLQRLIGKDKTHNGKPTQNDIESKSSPSNRPRLASRHMTMAESKDSRDKSRSNTAAADEVNIAIPNAHSQRKFPNPLKQPSERQTSSYLRKQRENVTFSQPVNSSSKTLEKDSNEFSGINGPRIGFQYEIIVPPTPLPTPPPPSKNVKKYFVNASTHYERTTTSVPQSIITEFNEYNRTTSATTLNTTHPQAAAITPQIPSQSQITKIKHGNDASTASTKYNKGSHKTTWPNSQHPPTPNFQLNMHLKGISKPAGNVANSNGSNIIHKTHLPLSGTRYPNNANETHTEIKPNNMGVSWTINHIPSTTPTATTTTSITTSTFLPIVKRGGEWNSSKNTLLTIQSQALYHQPTQSYSTARVPTQQHAQQLSPESMFDNEGATTSNQSFHRLTSSMNLPPRVPDAGSKQNRVTQNRDLNLDRNQTAIIRRRNMFTVINKVNPRLTIQVENKNATTKTKEKDRKPNRSEKYSDNITLNLQGNEFHDRTNQLTVSSEPIATTSILTGPDKSGKLTTSGYDNDYFDDDETQKKLQHWIESDQGKTVSASTELPRFTNLTWPYYGEKNSSTSIPHSGVSSLGTHGAAASTALSVSFTSQRDQKTPAFSSQYEFYIPSAAADPLRKPILVTKRRNKTAEATLESTYLIPPAMPTQATSTTTMKVQDETGIYHLKQTDHKSKIKHSHWGSKGLNIKLKPPKGKPFSYQLQQKQQQHNIKVLESATGNPKSTSAHFTTSYSHTTPPVTFTTFKHQKHFVTSPSSANTWPFGGIGQTEMASFVTAKTPTNIWYKPTINHFTAGIPINGSHLYDKNNQVIDIVTKPFTGSTTTPTSTSKVGYYVGDDATQSYNAAYAVSNKVKTSQGELSSSNTVRDDYPNNAKGPILFKVWRLGPDGKLKLQEQREIPAWALHGYIMPNSGTILNLKQIPQSLQPLVTTAMNKEAAESNPKGDRPYIWHPLPLISSPGMTSTTTPIPITNYPNGFLTGDDTHSNSVKGTTGTGQSSMGWGEEDVGEVTYKQPVLFNYVIWNNPSSIYGQSIIPSTPSPQLLPQPTPVSYFPPSPITQESTSKTPSVAKYPESAYTSKPNVSPASLTYEELELLFQKYFQTPTTTNAHTSTTTAPPAPLVINKVPPLPDTPQSSTWKDLKKVIASLASKNSTSSNDKASFTLDKDKSEDLELVGNVASLALIMSYLQQHHDTSTTAVTQPRSTTTMIPFGVTDDMTPPHRDQLWATVYPLFQHFLNNPNYTFIPPPGHYPLSPQTTTPYLSLPLSPVSPQTLPSTPSTTPTSPTPSPLTEPTDDGFIRFNHYASYFPVIPESPTKPSLGVNQIAITKVPKHGATTQQNLRSEGKLGELDDSYIDSYPPKSKTLLIIKKIKKNKKFDKKKKKHKLTKALLGAALLHKISKPLLHVVKQPSKYWLDLKFDIDFYDLIKKQLLYFLAIRYMPVVMILALGVLPFALSFVPLFYKMFWLRWKKSKPKYIKVPMPYPEPYPVHVPVYPPPPPPPPYVPHNNHHDENDDYDHYGNHPPEEHLHKHSIIVQDHDHREEPFPIGVPPPLHANDYHYAAADTSGNSYSTDDRTVPPNSSIKLIPPPPPPPPPPPTQLKGSRYPKVINSFNYDETDTSDSQRDHIYQKAHSNQEHGQEIHVHLHDDDIHDQQALFTPTPVTRSPLTYTSYTNKDLQPYPVTHYPASKTYEIGFDIGQTLAGMTNKHDMEILKILVENKRDKLKRLLEMWNLAKYGMAVASNAVSSSLSNSPISNIMKHAGAAHSLARRRRRRRKRKHNLPTIKINDNDR